MNPYSECSIKSEQSWGNVIIAIDLRIWSNTTEAYVGKSTKAQVRSKFKRGRGTQKQSKVAVMAVSTVLEDPVSGKFDKSCWYFKMKKIKNLEEKTAQALIIEYIDLNSVLQTDKSTTFSDLSDCMDVHVRELSGTKEGNFILKWVHIAIS